MSVCDETSIEKAKGKSQATAFVPQPVNRIDEMTEWKDDFRSKKEKEEEVDEGKAV